MVKVFLSLSFCILLLSCKSNSDFRNMSGFEKPFGQIKNDILKSEIELYHEKVNMPESPRLLHIFVSQVMDTTIYQLLYSNSAFGLITTPSTYYFLVNDNVIALSYLGVKEVGLPDSIAWAYLKEIFPEEYAYYQANNEFPPPRTGSEVVWRLKFYDGKLICRQESVSFTLF
ncbi:MAG TPA: hypothetical protein VLH37_08200 [Bacteroidales bacterium]|nr:hypothetical protein [Bacteroidales bacterium]